MDTYRTEEEQVEAIKKFFKEYGTKVLAAILVVVAAFFGIRSYQHSTLIDKEGASALYSKLTTAVPAQGGLDDQNKPVFDAAYAALLKDYPESTYASYAALFKARFDVDAKNLDEAEKSLRWVIDQKANDEVVALANVRLAKVLAASGRPEEALSLVKQPQGGLNGVYAETEGDILVQLNKPAAALAAYEKAVAAREGQESLTSRMLTMKIDSLKQTDQDKLHPYKSADDEAQSNDSSEAAQEQ